MAGPNGYIISTFDGSFIGEFGETCAEGDAVGFKTVANRQVLVKALAAAGGTQQRVHGICPSPMEAGGYEAIRKNLWRMAFPYPLPAALVGIKPGDPVFASDTVAGGMTRTAPVGAGKYSQKLGIAYYDADLRRGQPANADANSMLIDVQEPVTL